MSKLRENIILAQKVARETCVVHCLVVLFAVIACLGLQGTSLIDWDEGVFALQGKWIATIGQSGKPFNFQTPPLFQTLVAVLFRMFEPRDFFLRLLSIVFSCITVYLVYSITKDLHTRRVALYSVLLFMSSELFFFFSRSGLSDATFTCFFCLALAYFIRGVTRKRNFDFCLAGIFATFALYTKYSAVPLLVVFLIIGIVRRKSLPGMWLVWSTVLPVLLFFPFVCLYVRVVSLSEFGVRHVTLLGFSHFKYLFYAVRFAPVPLALTVLALLFTDMKKNAWLYALAIIIYFGAVGFYFPFFRLVYPIVPLLSVLGGFGITRFKKYANHVLAGVLVLSLFISADTILYSTSIPKYVAKTTDLFRSQFHVPVTYAIVPPNVGFYLDGSIAIPANHPWTAIGRKFPVAMKARKIIYPEINELPVEGKTLLVFATASDSVKQQHARLFDRCTLLVRCEFTDAPVYYKDIYNKQRNIEQNYEIYLFDNGKLGSYVDTLWNLGFVPGVTVLYADQDL